LVNRHYSPDNFVFINRIGNHYTDSRLRKIFNKAKKKARYNSITLNVFGRHSKGLQLKLAGASDEQIASILCNTTKIVHETYTHVEAGGKAKILSLLDKQKEKAQTDFGGDLAVERFIEK
jgi:site-specific recombinase XerD|tara:strand:+ start:83 stop:442 length:360 start_codon:yes stop_codon:yes gene_type:complete